MYDLYYNLFLNNAKDIILQKNLQTVNMMSDYQ